MKDTIFKLQRAKYSIMQVEYDQEEHEYRLYQQRVTDEDFVFYHEDKEVIVFEYGPNLKDPSVVQQERLSIPDVVGMSNDEKEEEREEQEKKDQEEEAELDSIQVPEEPVTSVLSQNEPRIQELQTLERFGPEYGNAQTVFVTLTDEQKTRLDGIPIQTQADILNEMDRQMTMNGNPSQEEVNNLLLAMTPHADSNVNYDSDMDSDADSVEESRPPIKIGAIIDETSSDGSIPPPPPEMESLDTIKRVVVKNKLKDGALVKQIFWEKISC